MNNRKRILYLITKSNWGGALWETLGFPNPAYAGRPSSTGKLEFSRPLSCPTPTNLGL